jgi:methylated-DNA-[protein]-cysteine S-methyltransferase
MKINQKTIYELIAKIPAGKVSTYKELARKISSKAYRAIGQVVGKNPDAPEVPCHRIIKNNGEIGGYVFGVNKKITLLRLEGVEVKENKIVDFEEKIFKF